MKISDYNLQGIREKYYGGKSWKYDYTPSEKPQEESRILPTLDDIGTIFSNTGNLLSNSAAGVIEGIGNLAETARPYNPNHLANSVIDKISEVTQGASDYLRENAGTVKPARDSALGSIATDLQSGVATGY